MFDYAPGDDLEDILAGRLDADREQAAAERLGAVITWRRNHGICCHQRAVGYSDAPEYPEQQGLGPGELRCTEHTAGCQRIFDSEDHWRSARREAVDHGGR